MISIQPQCITDATGVRLSVVIPIDVFNVIIEEFEDLEDIRLYNEAKADDEPSIPIDEAFKIIESKQ